MKPKKPFWTRVGFFFLWVFGIASIIYVSVTMWSIFWITRDNEKTQAAVTAIESEKLTMADVMGTNLPPAPDPAQNDATLEGIDANHNGIRDDVELAIFKEYPSSPFIRAAELQYAMELQNAFSNVFNSDTWVAYAESTSRGSLCISETAPRTTLVELNQVTNERTQEVENTVFNTSSRKDKEKQVDDLITAFGIPNEEPCDVNLGSN